MFLFGLVMTIMSPWFWIVSPDEAGKYSTFATAAVGIIFILLSSVF